MPVGGETVNETDSEARNVLRRRRKKPTDLEEEELSARWREVIRSYRSAEAGAKKDTSYPRRQRLLDIVREDGRIKLMLDYDEENPSPNLNEYGQRRQIESILGFEESIEHLIADVESRWNAHDFEGEAALLEEFANSNPQRDAILSLAAEARRDSLSGASARVKPRRRDISGTVR